MKFKLKRGRKSFKKELKRQLKYAIAAGVGLLIAYAWKEAIFNSAEEIIEKIVNNSKETISSISTSVLITIIGVLIILLSARLLREK
jgi:xanthine/uracil/vitamin C permease (AzgA family)